MIKVDDNTFDITIIRGDSGYVLVPLVKVTVDEETGEETETPYSLQEGEKLRFAMAKNWGSSKEECCIIRDIDPETTRLYFYPEDTKPLKFGTYKYDLEYVNLDGFVDTILRAKFKVAEEVY